MTCEFDALADLKELQIEKSPDTLNTRLQIASEPRTEHFLNLLESSVYRSIEFTRECTVQRV